MIDAAAKTVAVAFSRTISAGYGTEEIEEYAGE